MGVHACVHVYAFVAQAALQFIYFCFRLLRLQVCAVTSAFPLLLDLRPQEILPMVQGLE